jgi:hypothetical protein
LIFLALIPKASKIRDILFESDRIYYSPNFLIADPIGFVRLQKICVAGFHQVVHAGAMKEEHFIAG